MVQWTIISGAIGLIATISGCVLGWIVFPTMINNKVAKSVVIADGTEQFERFVKVPQPLSFKVYIFNVTNPESVQQGAIPIVQELGPYIYKQFRRKIIKEFSRDGTTVSYSQQQYFEFDKLASSPASEFDSIVALNMHMNAFLQVFEREIKDIFKNFVTKFNRTLDRTPGVRLLKRILERIRGKRKITENDPGLAILMSHINANLKGVFNNQKSMFVSTTVREYLFDGVKFCINPTGLARAICKQIKEQASRTIRLMDDGSLGFSFFNHKNKTDDRVIQVHTGLNSPENLLRIQKWHDSEQLHVWLNSTNGETSVCNMINGTDASSYPPFRQHGDSMYIFSPDICRSVQLYYTKDVSYNGIPGYRYSTGFNFLNDIGPEFSNECFCVDRLVNIIKRKNGCLYAGALDLSECIHAPVILTLPHMLGAAKEYTSMIKGLKPIQQKHQTYVDVQRLTGTPLQGGKRVQFNMFLKQINRIKLTENLTTSLMPSIWVEEGIALNPEMVKVLKSKLINTLEILELIQYSMIACGTVVFVVSVILHFVSKNGSKGKVTSEPPLK